jgi:hypothetical protein
MFFRKLFIEIKEVAVPLFKILIPFVFIIKLFEMMGFITLLAKIFAPLMNIIGLPPELGIVWVTALVVNIYAALVLFINLIPGLEVTVAQITVLTTAILICHNLLIECAISKSAGISFIYTFIFRILSAFIICFIIHHSYAYLNILQEPYSTLFTIEPMREGFVYWLEDQAMHLLYILGIVIIMVTVLQVLKKIGVENFLKKILVPPLKLFGIGKDAMNIVIVGMTIGLQFGGGILIKEVNTGKIDKQSVFLAVSMLNLVHAIIEDTILMLAVGGHYSGVIVARIVFGLLISLMMFKLYQKYNRLFEKYIFSNNLRSLPKIKD